MMETKKEGRGRGKRSQEKRERPNNWGGSERKTERMDGNMRARKEERKGLWEKQKAWQEEQESRVDRENPLLQITHRADRQDAVRKSRK